MKTFDSLYQELAQRAATRPDGSNTVALLDAGVHEIGKKVVEEAAEHWMPAEYESDEQVALEASQLIYHLQLILLARGIKLEQVQEVL